MAMLSAVHFEGGQVPYFLFSFDVELELIKSSSQTWFNATSDTVSRGEMN